MMNLFQKYWKSHDVTSKELREAFELIGIYFRMSQINEMKNIANLKFFD